MVFPWLTAGSNERNRFIFFWHLALDSEFYGFKSHALRVDGRLSLTKIIRSRWPKSVSGIPSHSDQHATSFGDRWRVVRKRMLWTGRVTVAISGATHPLPLP